MGLQIWLVLWSSTPARRMPARHGSDSKWWPDAKYTVIYVVALAQDCSNSSALALELLQSYVKLSMCTITNNFFFDDRWHILHWWGLQFSKAKKSIPHMKRCQAISRNSLWTEVFVHHSSASPSPSSAWHWPFGTQPDCCQWPFYHEANSSEIHVKQSGCRRFWPAGRFSHICQVTVDISGSPIDF